MALLKYLQTWWRERANLRLLEQHCREIRGLGYEEDDARCNWSKDWERQRELIQIWSGSREQLRRATDHVHVGLADYALQEFIDRPGPESADVLSKALHRKGLQHTASIGLFLTNLYDESNRDTVFAAVVSELERKMRFDMRILSAFEKRPEPALIDKLLAIIRKRLTFTEPVGISVGFVVKWHNCHPLSPEPEIAVSRHVIADVQQYQATITKVWEQVRESLSFPTLEYMKTLEDPICVLCDGHEMKPGMEWTSDDEAHSGHTEPPDHYLREVYTLTSISFQPLRDRAAKELRRRRGEPEPAPSRDGDTPTRKKNKHRKGRN